MSHVPLATSAPSWTLAVSLWSHLTLSSHKSLSHLQPRGQLLGCPCCCFLRPSSTRPILFLAPPHSGTFVSLGLATVSRWEQELLRGPWSFPGSPCGMQGNVSCGRPACPAWPPASSHCFPSPIQARGWEQDQNKVGTPAMPWAPLWAFIVTMLPTILAVPDVPLKFLDLGRSGTWRRGPGSLSTGEERGALASVIHNTVF